MQAAGESEMSKIADDDLATRLGDSSLRSASPKKEATPEQAGRSILGDGEKWP